MDNLPLILLCATIVANIVLGLLILRSVKKEYSWLFLFVTFSVALWAFGDLLMLYSHASYVINIGLRLFYIAPMITPIALLLFSGAFPDGTNSKEIKYIISIVIFLVAAVPILLNINVLVESVVTSGPINTIIPIKLPFILYSMFLSTIFFLSYINFIIKIFNTKGEERTQISYAFVGVLISSSLALSTNIVLPLFAIYDYVWLGPPMTMIAVIMIAMAIARYRLFDIRLTAVRALGYILFLISLALIYVFVINIIGTFVLKRKGVDNVELITNMIVAMILVLTFEPLRKKVDKLTSKIFYRDAYDPQEVLNKLNAQLVKSKSIDDLAGASIDIIEDNIHPQFVCFAFLDSSNILAFYYGSKKVKLSDIEENNLASFIMSNSSRTAVLDDMSLGHHSNVKKIIDKHQISLVTKLVVGDETIGFEFLSDRKSGNAYSGRDVQLLETAADSIAIAAQNALRYKEIAAFNVTLQKKVDDATNELQKTNERLKALDDAKDEFISMASHQLRTPLTSIKGYISMLLEGDGGKLNEIQRKFLDQAFISSQRMVYLIADLLNVSRVKTGKFVIEPKPTYLPDVVTSELGQLTETAKARGLKLVFALPPANFPMLNLDDTKIRQVIMNFADNAIYYTPKGGTITVALAATNDAVECTVSDTGIGVPIHDQHHLFTKFYRAGNAKKARPDGTGLGLFMAKKVIAAQGGALIFKSTEGKGSVFGFSFPRAKLEVAESPGIKNDNI